MKDPDSRQQVRNDAGTSPSCTVDNRPPLNLLPQNVVRRVPEAAEKVIEKMAQVHSQRHRLVLILGDSGAGKTPCLREVAELIRGRTVHNVGLDLSRQLLELPEVERPLRVRERFEELVTDAGDPVLLDNLEVLFQRSLRQQPLLLLESVSRARTVVAAWRGSVSDGKLQYAVPGHPEFRRHPVNDLAIVDLNASEGP